MRILFLVGKREEQNTLYYIGIDLGGTNIAVGVVDGNYRIISRSKAKTPMPCVAEQMSALFEKLIFEALENAGLTLEDVPYIGVGVPAGIDHNSGVIGFVSNLRMHDWHLQEDLSARLGGKKVLVENDANAAAYGEYKAGVLAGAKNALAITLGTGIGSGIIIDGKIYTGSNFMAGEAGHTVIEFGGRECSCGRRGCWERYASATGLIQSTKEYMQSEQGKGSAMWKLAEGDLEKVSGRTAFDAMREGDAGGRAVVDGFIRYLGCGIANMINILQPDILCIGGGISHEGETLLAPLREYVRREEYAHTSEKTKICKAELGNDAGIIGAALLGV